MSIWEDQIEESLGIGFVVLVHYNFSLWVENADIHVSNVKIDTAIVLVLLEVKSHGLASALHIAFFSKFY